MDVLAQQPLKNGRPIEPPPRTVAGNASIVEGPWGHLLQWEQSVDKDECVDLADLDEVEAYDESLEDADADADAMDFQEQEEEGDIDAEQPHLPRPRCKLSEQEIVDIINERIAYYTNLWVPNKGVPREDLIMYDPEQMWEDAEAKGQRAQLVARHKAELDYFTQGLDMLCTEIVNNPGNNADIIRRQCNNLEVTIDNMELNRWLISIYELSPEPESGSDDRDDVDSHDQTPRPSSILAASQPMIISLESPSPSPRSRAESVTDMRDQTTASSLIENPSTSNVLPLRPGISGSLFNYGDEPEHASITTVRRWRWEDLVETQDRKRVISKAIYELPTADREALHNKLALVERVSMGNAIKTHIGMMRRGQSTMQDVHKIGLFSNLFLSWWLSDNYLFKTPPKHCLEEMMIMMDEDGADLEVFIDFLSTVLVKTTFSKEALQHPDRPSQAEIIEISDDDDDDDDDGEAVLASTEVQGGTASTMPPGLQQVSTIILD